MECIRLRSSRRPNDKGAKFARKNSKTSANKLAKITSKDLTVII